jgi:hypothetical protein
LSVVGSVEGEAIKFLVDTGSAITIISTRSYQKFGINDDNLEALEYDVCTADGKKLKIFGATELELIIGPLLVKHKFIVADISSSAILGMDFLDKHKCSIDVSKSILRINETPVNLWRENVSSPLSCRVSVKEFDCVPAKSEKIIGCNVQRRGGEQSCNILEGTNLFETRSGLFVGRSLHDISSGQIHVRVCNPNNWDINLRSGTTVGLCYPVNGIHEDQPTVQLNSVQLETNTEQNVEIPEFLKELWDRSCIHLNDEEMAQFKQLLFEYQDIFSNLMVN